MTKRYRALLFDLDDTLLDFAKSEEASLRTLHAEYFIDRLHFAPFIEKYQRFNQVLWQKVTAGEVQPSEVKQLRFKQLIEHHQLDLNHEIVAKRYEYLLGHSIFWLPGAETVLPELKPHFKLGILSNGLSSVQSIKCQLTGLDKLCDTLIFSEAIGYSKPHINIFNHALKELKLSAEDCLMIGDSLPNDFQGALNAGMDFYWINHQNTALGDYPTPTKVFTELQTLKQTLLEVALAK